MKEDVKLHIAISLISTANIKDISRSATQPLLLSLVLSCYRIFKYNVILASEATKHDVLQ